MVSALGMAGIACVTVAVATEPVRHSRFVVDRVDLGDGSDPARVVEQLHCFAQSQSTPPVLFYQTDADLLLVSRYRDRLQEAFCLMLPEPELAEDLVDKARFAALAQELHLPVPPLRVLAADVDGRENDLRYPLVLSP